MTNLSEMYLTSNEALIDIMSRARDMGRYGIDLEFIREKSYFPKYLIISLSDFRELPNHLVCIFNVIAPPK